MRLRPDLSEASAESGEHLLHIAPLLHGDDPQVVLFVDPHQESLIVIVPGGGRGIVKPKALPEIALDHTQKDAIGG